MIHSTTKKLLQAGFLKSSPKITFHPRLPKYGSGSMRHTEFKTVADESSSSSPVSRTNSPYRSARISTPTPPLGGYWICPICTFSNPVSPNFDPANASSSAHLSPCLACGIKPPFAVVLKAAIAAASKRGLLANHDMQSPSMEVAKTDQSSAAGQSTSTLVCPRCTFHNHVSLPACEICGAPLQNEQHPLLNVNGSVGREEPPGPLSAGFDVSDSNNPELNSIKISFRAGGDKNFHEKIKGAMTQRKWLLQSAPPVPNPLPSFKTDSFNEEGGSALGQL